MLRILAFLLLGLFIYWSPITHPRYVNLDDAELYKPLENVQSIQDYLAMRDQGLIEDIEPVRDLSFWTELRLQRLVGYFNPQFDNLLIWGAITILLFSVLGSSGLTSKAASLICLFIFIHPVAVNSVAWPSARKHLLSALFILWATERSLKTSKNAKNSWSALALYALSVLSQPINVLWGVWYLAYSRNKIWVGRKSPQQILHITTLGLIAVSVAAANFFYYHHGAYVKLAGQSKFQPESWERFGDRLLAVGRYIYQLVWPVSPSFGPYFLGSYSSLFGFILLLFLLVFVVLKRPKFLLSHWLLFMILPLLVVILPTTEHAGWDTYLLTPLLGFGLYLGELSTRKLPIFEGFKINPRLLIGVLLTSVFTLTWISRQAADAWSDELTFWQRAYDTDPGALQTSGLLKVHYVTDKDPAEILRLTNLLLKNYPKHRDLAYLLGRMIYERPLPENVKEELFAKNKRNSIWYIYYEAAFEASRKNFAKSENLLREGLFSGAFDSIYELGENLPEFAAGWYFACEKSSLADCDPKLEELKSKNLAYFWNQEKFERRLQSFRAH